VLLSHVSTLIFPSVLRPDFLSAAAKETAALFEEEKATHQSLQQRARELETQVQEIENLNRTISLLVNEKSSLSANVENLQGVQARESLHRCL
jgi:predicted RNase H-like nuclease (RuvC/YqgF family)